MEAIGGIIVVILAILALVVAVKMFLAILPFLLGAGAIALVAYIVICVISSNGGSDYTNYVNQKANEISSKATHIRSEAQRRYHESAISQVYIKSGVNLNSLQPAMDSSISAIVEAFQRVVGSDYFPTVTSGDDYEGHASQSAHYSGAALDFRLKDIDDPELREMVTVAVREALDDRFFVDHEFPGQAREHLHVQLRRGTYDKVAWR